MAGTGRWLSPGRRGVPHTGPNGLPREGGRSGSYRSAFRTLRIAPTMDAVARGKLRIYLGYAPGVGTTYSALAEAQRRAANGAEVLVGAAVTHGRRHTGALLEGLRTMPLHESGSMDVIAVIARVPDLVVVDELHRVNPPGSRNPTRWQDVEDIRAAGILSLIHI